MNRTIIVLFVLLACQPPSQKKGETDIKAIKEDIFDIHDAIMPKMGDLRRMRKDLMLTADSIQNTDSITAKSLVKIAETIATANQNMMKWMRNFDPDYKGTNKEILNYMKRQKREITKVKKDMLSSLEKGKNRLRDRTKN